MHKYKITIILIFAFSFIQAQETYISTGGNATGTTGNMSYSIGQVFYSTKTGTNGNYINEGVQQPYEITILSNTKFAKNIKLTAYPNPTTDYLKIDLNNYESNNVTFQLFNINGKILKSGKINNNQVTKINTTKLNSAIYILKINDNNKQIKTFKIIKQ